MEFLKTLNNELNRKTIDEFKNSEKTPLVFVLDNVRSMNNIGSIFRTSDAFLIEKIYLCGISSCPPHREINKTALGATETVSWEYEKDILILLKKLKSIGYTIISIEQTNKSVLLNNVNFNSFKKIAFILGNEMDGIQNNALIESDLCIEIPQFGTKHSINISVCAGIIAWQFYSQKYMFKDYLKKS